MKNNLFSSLKDDLPAGLVVFLVAVPLCLGIALASGAPLFSGIIAGMVGGIVVTSFSGSQLGVSGPAAGLAVIVLAAIQDLGSFDIFLMAVVIAGVIQVVLGILRAGIIGYYFPSSVIKGMLAAIGIIIFLKQIPHAFGYDADPEGDLGFVQADGENTFSELLNMLNFISPGAITIATLSLAILIIWEQKFMKKIKVFQIVQGPLVVVVTGIVLGMVFQGSDMAITADHMVSIPVADSLAGFANQFTLPDFTAITNPQVWVVGITMAIVASLETLLCVEATDKLDPQKRVTPPSQELRAQGIGNMVAGLIGGLPVTQVIVRSSANIQSGGKTRMSALFHGLLIFFSALLIPNVLNLIPLASLAAILLVVGYKLAKPALFKQMYKTGWKQFIPFVVTVLAIVFTDLLVGIGIGLAVAIVFILFNNLKNPYILKNTHDQSNKHFRIVLSEQVTFLNKAQILKELNRIPENTELLIDGSKTVSIEHDVLEIIADFKESAKFKNIDLKLYGMENLDFNGYDDVLGELVVDHAVVKNMPSDEAMETKIPNVLSSN
ncbi:SulP family inorganic anion transporter [Roseivirga pacifica]|uniref:SulP family inorganic anion transporter n=1 Tax=Roseivirga pacifica TaxID=1267423 RepID=UPI0020949D2E|nr:SulP family inorganic anion transporter [Roseivirga pacifica]MCO6357666.1 SulP family inorganic anion transporter [Roseivirga pacifica]MCO6365919.1 SulP family inorganic anion transporter [Roseivirga pacifica]MCO6371247.1 SulP family inorganic anion transporter [Roseivirga pacifica]MCO6375582.1 SulP family inorganic anion transporter [Roseivirga pacifica]MCO6378625.1 SulP family inorganic anion transporter [Roseivirga pacifica]